MVLIYIRHSHDDYGEATHRHDHRITSLGKEKAKEVGQQLIAQYGMPSLIYCSPFKRTKQTLRYMLHKYEKADLINVKVKYDNNLSRYFNSKEQEDPSVFPETNGVPIVENKKQFQTRINNHIREVENYGFVTGAVGNKAAAGAVGVASVVWCITHALVFKRIAKYHEVNIPEHIPFMEYFIVPPKKEKEPKEAKDRKESKEPKKPKDREADRESDHKSNHKCPRCGKIH